MTDAIWWLLAAGALIGAELFTRAFFALFVAFGALVAALVAASGVPFVIQGSTMVAAALVGIVIARPPLMRAMRSGHRRLVSGARGLVGREAVVSTTIGGINSPGKIRAQGELWTAYSDDDEAIAPGTPVLILDLDGSRFVVHALPGP